MRRRLPPIEQIEAFIQAARGPTFRAAAERCALSPAAFSRRIQAFESSIGAEMFERRGGNVRLTQVGQRCLDELEPAYRELRRAAAGVSAGETSQCVTLSLSHSLAVGWLIPRLDSLARSHPDIELSFRARRDATDVRCGDADLGLCYSDIDLSGLASRPLLDVSVTPVAAPAIAAAMRNETLGDFRLLTVTAPPKVWERWARATNSPPPPKPSVAFDIVHAMYESASEGFGIALGAWPTVQPFLDSGKLVPIGMPVARLPGGAYHLTARPERKCRRSVETVWRWLEREAEHTPPFWREGVQCGGKSERRISARR